MKKKYWIVDEGIEKGPFDFKDLINFKAKENTYIWYKGLENWVEFKTLSDYKDFSNYKYRRKLRRILLPIISVLVVLFMSLFVYYQLSFTEKKAIEKAQNLLSLLRSDSKSEEIKSLYPSYSKIGRRLVINKEYQFQDVIKSSNNTYYVNFLFSNKYPILIEVGRDGFGSSIKSTKGLSYSYYNHIRDYGIKKGILGGHENDVELGRIIEEENLELLFDKELYSEIEVFKKNISIDSGIIESGGYFPTLSGNVLVINDNPISISFNDMSFELILYDWNGNKIKVKPLNYFGNNGNSTSYIHVYEPLPDNARSYSVEYGINITESLKNKIVNFIMLKK